MNPPRLLLCRNPKEYSIFGLIHIYCYVGVGLPLLTSNISKDHANSHDRMFALDSLIPLCGGCLNFQAFSIPSLVYGQCRSEIPQPAGMRSSPHGSHDATW